MASSGPPKVDITLPAQTARVEGKNILITGGASGLGLAMFREFARHGANVVIADLNEEKGSKLVEEVRKESKNPNHHFLRCDVVSYDAQRQLFHAALALLPGGILNTVVANAGVGETYDVTKAHSPASEDPPEPDMTTIDVNVKGVIFTSRLALHHFQRNPPGTDRHLLLVGSMASLVDTCGVVAMYATSKHAVLGWFRSLRLYPGAHNKDARINLICPYFVATPIIPTMGRVMLAGMELATTEDVVEAAARLVSEPRARGRVLAVMPRKAGGISEIDETEVKALEQFSNRVIRALEAESRVKSCVLFVGDLVRLLGFARLTGVLGVVIIGCWMRCT